MADYIVHKAVEVSKCSKAVKPLLSEPGYLEANYIAQAKYDGCNLTIIVQAELDGYSFHAYSRTGEEVKSVEHIFMAMAALPDLKEGAYLGEAWTPDAEFKDISGWFRRQKPDEDTCRLQFVIFDFIPLREYDAGVCELPYTERCELLPETLYRIKQGAAPLWVATSFGKLAESLPGNSAQHVANKLVAAGGFDGLILRNPLSGWTKGHNGSDGSIIKIKPLLRVSCVVVDYELGKGKHEGKIGTLVVEYKGVRQGAGTGLKDSERDITEFGTRWRGLIVEIEALGETPDGKLREPRLKGVRSDVVEAD